MGKAGGATDKCLLPEGPARSQEASQARRVPLPEIPKNRLGKVLGMH